MDFTMTEVLEEDLVLQQYFHCMGVLVAGIAGVFLFAKIKKISLEFSVFQIDAADYTLMLSGLPPDFTDVELTEYLTTLSEGVTPDVDAVIRTYDISRASQISSKVIKLKKIIKKQELNGVTTLNLTEKLKHLEAEQLNAVESAQANVNHIVFVTFSKLSNAKELLEGHRRTPIQYGWDFVRAKLFSQSGPLLFRGKHVVEVRQASHPLDILWENCKSTRWSRLKSAFWTYSCSFFLLATVTVILIVLKIAQNDWKHDLDEADMNFWLYSLGPALFATVVNLLLEVFLYKVTKWELHLCRTSRKISTTRKLIVLLFLNTAVIPIIVNSYQGLDWFDAMGLATDALNMIILNSLATPLLYLFNWRFLTRHFVHKYLALKNPIKSQFELNNLFKPIKFVICERYAQVISMLHVGLFYMPLLPVGLPIVIVGIIMEHYFTKVMLLRVHSRPNPLSEELGVEMGKWMMFSVVSYAGGIVFFYSCLDGVQLLSIGVTILATAFLLFPITTLVSKKSQRYAIRIAKNVLKGAEECFRRYRLFLDTVKASKIWDKDLNESRTPMLSSQAKRHINFSILRTATANAILSYMARQKQSQRLGKIGGRDCIEKQLSEQMREDGYNHIMRSEDLMKIVYRNSDI